MQDTTHLVELVQKHLDAIRKTGLHPNRVGFEKEQELLIQQPELAEALVSANSKLIYKVRREVGYHNFPSEDLPAEAVAAWALGYTRASYTHYSREVQGWSDEDWRVRRKEFGTRRRDASRDFEVAVAHFGREVLMEYAPVLTAEEVTAAAVTEFRQIFTGPGTVFSDSRKRNGADCLTAPAPQYTSVAEVGELDYANYDEQPFGPVMEEIIVAAAPVIGMSRAFYWAFERTVFPKKYAELLRFFGHTEEEVGEKEFGSQKRQLARTLPEATVLLEPVFRESPALRGYYDMLFD
jgi:hypothetical protein